MNGDVLLGVDAGTSQIKVVAFDLNGSILARAAHPTEVETNRDGSTAQDALKVWAALCASLEQLAEHVPNLKQRAASLGLTSHGDGTWLIDKSHAPLGKPWVWSDSRAAKIADRLASSDAGRFIYRTTGTALNAGQMRTQIPWMLTHTPEIVERAHVAFHCKDWLYLQLTGEIATDPADALADFGDFRTRSYSGEVIEACGLQNFSHLFAPILEGGQTTHKLIAAAAEATGLAAGLPVSLAYADVVCCAIGAGLLSSEKRAVSIVGSTGMHIGRPRTPDEVVLQEDPAGFTLALPDGRVSQSQSSLAATLNLDWVTRLAGQILKADLKSSELLQSWDDDVLSATPAKAIYHPYISQAGERGPFVDAYASASFSGLSEFTTWFDMVRAVYEGISFAARDCHEVVGSDADQISLTGGASQSNALRQIFASTLNKEIVSISHPDSGALGAAIFAAIAGNQFSSFEEANQAWIEPHVARAAIPDENLARSYEAAFERYIRTQKALRETWKPN